MAWKTKKHYDHPILRIIMATIISIVITGCLIFIYYSTGVNYSESATCTEFSTGWTVQLNDWSTDNQDLNHFILKNRLAKGDTVTLINRLPDSWAYSAPVLRLETEHSLISVEIDGRTAYSYGQERFSQNKMIGSGNQYVNLEDHDKGKIIKVSLTTEKNNAFTYIDPLYITDYSDVYMENLTKYRIPYLLGNFLFFFGVILIATGIVVYVKAPHLIRLVWIGLLSSCVGIWTLCYYRLAQMYAIPLFYCTFFEYLSLYVGIVSSLLYFKSNISELDNKFLRGIYYGLLTVESVYSAAMIILGANNIIFISCGLGFVQLMIIVNAIYITMIIIIMIRKGSSDKTIMLIGFLIAVLMIATDALNYLLLRSIRVRLVPIPGLASFGILVYVILVLIAFALEISAKLRISTEKEMLYRMAYTDALTQAHNRRYCEEVMERLEKNNTHFGVFNFDLNEVKIINDSLGHSYGDELIQGFAKILKKTFGQIGIIARIGGDEFIVIIENNDDFQQQSYIDKLMNNISIANEKEKHFNYSVSYGYADSSEVKNQTESCAMQVYTLADRRMYKHKRKYKEAMGNNE
jgi:diguanylate cyclase (GGDEF)-like protein